MINASDIHSLTEFQRNARAYIERLKRNRRPEVLTVNGKAELVVQDTESYQELLDRVERAEAIAGIRQGLESMKRGEGVPLEEAEQRMRKQHGIPD